MACFHGTVHGPWEIAALVALLGTAPYRVVGCLSGLSKIVRPASKNILGEAEQSGLASSGPTTDRRVTEDDARAVAMEVLGFKRSAAVAGHALRRFQ